MIVRVPRNFSFTTTVESHGWFRLAPFRWSRDEGVLRRREPEGELEISCRKGALHVVERRPLRAPNADGRSGRRSTDLAARITRMFQLDVDIAEFVELTRDSPAHTWVAKAGFGRLLCGATLWEDAVKIIATTNTMWSQTVRMVEFLVAKCGRDGEFPTPREVVRFSEEELQRIGELVAKARKERKR